MPIPITEASEVTPQWLTEVLRRRHNAWSGQVSGVTVVLTKTLQVSRIARLKVEYSERSHDKLPDFLFLKLSAPEAPFENPAEVGSEVEFYRSVAAEMDDSDDSPLVRCYDAQFSIETAASHLLLEDLSATHFQSKQAEHPSPDLSETAVDRLARFHAYWWDHPKLGKGVGKVFDQEWLDSFLAHLETSVTGFVEFLGNRLTHEQRHAYEQMLRSGRRIWGRLTDVSGLTIGHGDMHWWNFLFPNDPKADRTRILDWQLWHIDLGPRDLAFLIGLGGFAERRRELEMHLLRTYHDSLVRYGVQNYSWTQFWDDYRWSAIRNLNIPVIFRSQSKHPSTWGNALDRAFQSYNELECEELLQ